MASEYLDAVTKNYSLAWSPKDEKKTLLKWNILSYIPVVSTIAYLILFGKEALTIFKQKEAWNADQKLFLARFTVATVSIGFPLLLALDVIGTLIKAFKTDKTLEAKKVVVV